MTKKESVAGEVIRQCLVIMLDPNETPARQRRAEYWFDRLSAGNGEWGNDGKTMAEAAGIEVPANAPGGAKQYPGGSSGGRRYTGQPLEDDDEAGLSSEVSSGYRSRRWSAEKSER